MFTIKISSLWVCTSKPWLISNSAFKNLRAQHPYKSRNVVSHDKVHLESVQTHMLVDRSSPDFFHRTQEELLSILDILTIIKFRRYSRSKSEFVWKSTEILHVLAPNFLVGDPEFLDLHYKIQPVSDHMWQSFTAIGQGSSEIWWQKFKKTSPSGMA